MRASFLAGLLGCSGGAGQLRPEPTFIQVELGTETVGTPEAPLPFPLEAFKVPITVRTLDREQQPHPLDGTLLLKVRPGKIEGETRIQMQGGVWTGELEFRYAFGPTRIWASDDIGDNGRETSFTVGVSEQLNFAFPTIREMQLNDDHETNNLDREFAELRLSDRQVIVTALDAAGFWATDAADPVGGYNGVYVYTFGRPDEEIQPGARLTLLTGNNQEYLATTQLSFPTIEVEAGSKYDLPPMVELDDASDCTETAIEGAEGSQVHITSGTIPADFMQNAEYSEKFTDYAEWPVTVGECTYLVVSNATAPDFYPPDHAGQVVNLTGQLKEIYGDPILVITDADDIVLNTAGPARPPASPKVSR